MIEPGGRNEYESLSPTERNAEFRRLLETFPFGLDDRLREEAAEAIAASDLTLHDLSDETPVSFFQRIIDITDRREDSELKQRIFPRIEALIELSTTTASFKNRIRQELGIYFTGGINHDVFEKNSDLDNNHPIRILLDFDNPEGEGIFGRDSRTIERYFYSEWFHDEEQTKLNTPEWPQSKLSERFKQRISHVGEKALASFLLTALIIRYPNRFKEILKLNREFSEKNYDPMEAPFGFYPDINLAIWRKEYESRYGETLRLLPPELFK